MPTLHRLATLRDDVIFFVYLYQSWKYKVDYSRVIEFGQGGNEEEVTAKLASKPLEAPAGGEVVAGESREADTDLADGKILATGRSTGTGVKRR